MKQFIGPFRQSVLTMLGVIIVLIGVVFIILPGPAFLLIPIGLALLSLEYPWARRALRKFQRYMSAAAAKMDKARSKK